MPGGRVRRPAPTRSRRPGRRCSSACSDRSIHRPAHTRRTSRHRTIRRPSARTELDAAQARKCRPHIGLLTSEGSRGQSALCLPRLATAEKTRDDRRGAGRAVHQHQVTAALDGVRLCTRMSAAMIRWLSCGAIGSSSPHGCRSLLKRLLTTVLDGLGWQRNQRAADQDVKTCPDRCGQP